jgi:predicted acylesterase/phospholipase RssA
MSEGGERESGALPAGKLAIEPSVLERTSAADDQYALIMKGGGLKGLAFVGAFRELRRFYEFDLYVGTSAGALVAALLGAEYTSEEMEAILLQQDFMEFIPERFSSITNLLFYGGLFRADTLSAWIEKLLAKKLNSPTRVEFSQLPKPVRVYACRRGTDALIFDSNRHPKMSVAHAVRCSIAIPFFSRQKEIKV